VLTEFAVCIVRNISSWQYVYLRNISSWQYVYLRNISSWQYVLLEILVVGSMYC